MWDDVHDFLFAILGWLGRSVLELGLSLAAYLLLVLPVYLLVDADWVWPLIGILPIAAIGLFTFVAFWRWHRKRREQRNAGEQES